MKSLSRFRFFATPWAVARQAAPSMGFSRQEYWSRLPFPSAEHLPKPGMEPGSPALPAGCSPSESPRKLPLAKLARNHDPSTGSATNPRAKVSVSLPLLRRRYSFFRRSEAACFPLAARYREGTHPLAPMVARRQASHFLQSACISLSPITEARRAVV